MPTTETLSEYAGDKGQYHLLLEPESSQYASHVVRKVADPLFLGLAKRFEILWTEDTAELTQEKIASRLKEGDTIISAGGDGRDSLVVNTLLTYEGLSPAVRRTPVLSIFGGNANMGPSELTPRRLFVPPPIMEVIDNGVIEEIHPLEAKISARKFQGIDEIYDIQPIKPFVTDGMLALYFVGLGLTGSAANELEEVRETANGRRDHVLGRNLVDAPAVVRGIRKARHTPFELTEFVYDAEDIGPPEDPVTYTKYDQAYEACLINGDRMAKFGRFPSKLTDEQFFKTIIQDNSWGHILRGMVKMKFAKLEGEMIAPNQTVHFVYKALCRDGVIWGQIDGDRYRLPPRGCVSVSQYPDSYRAVTLKRR